MKKVMSLVFAFLQGWEKLSRYLALGLFLPVLTTTSQKSNLLAPLHGLVMSHIVTGGHVETVISHRYV